jgi:phenylalanyl-tRNA synthetase alpha chain
VFSVSSVVKVKMNISELQQEFYAKLSGVNNTAALEELRNDYVGRKRGVITALLKDLPGLLPEERKNAGSRINEFKKLVETELERKKAELEQPGKIQPVDWTLPGQEFKLGAIHPITLVRQKIENIFRSMGYAIEEGPEIETDFYNFTALNFPPDHPARDTQDTLFVDRKDEAGKNLLLRTHTSPVQIRTMLKYPPPVRVLCPGRVYRKDEIDATHSPIFHQLEALVVDENITFADLKGTLLYFLQELFSTEVQLSFRPTFFPFTEPSADVSVSCVFCKSKGCSVCKNSGWIEILGSGMVHPNVLENVGYDSEKYTGFAFGLGLDRVAILLYGIPDIRLFFQNDERFLSQFRVSQ